MSLKSLKEFILNALEANKMSQRELALKAKLSPQALNVFLSKPSADLKVSSLIDIALALNISPAYILSTGEERRLWEAGKKAIPSIKDEIKALVDSLDDEMKLKFLKSSAVTIASYPEVPDVLLVKLKKSS